MNGGKGLPVQPLLEFEEVLLDERRITQVLTNLLGNALKFTPAAGQVVLAVKDDPQRPGWVLVTVSDTGRGITSEQCARIFDRLYQARNDEAVFEGGLARVVHMPGSHQAAPRRNLG